MLPGQPKGTSEQVSLLHPDLATPRAHTRWKPPMGTGTGKTHTRLGVSPQSALIGMPVECRTQVSADHPHRWARAVPSSVDRLPHSPLHAASPPWFDNQAGAALTEYPHTKEEMHSFPLTCCRSNSVQQSGEGRPHTVTNKDRSATFPLTCCRSTSVQQSGGGRPHNVTSPVGTP